MQLFFVGKYFSDKLFVCDFAFFIPYHQKFFRLKQPWDVLRNFLPSDQVKVVSSLAQDLYKLEQDRNIQLYRARILSLDLCFNSIELSF